MDHGSKYSLVQASSEAMAVDELVAGCDFGDDLDGVFVDCRLLTVYVSHVDNEGLTRFNGDAALGLERGTLLLQNLLLVTLLDGKCWTLLAQIQNVFDNENVKIDS